MKLSKRLGCIAQMIKKQASFNDKLADIGTDHGYLPCFLVEEKIINKAYACDVAIGPLESSKETIRMMDLETQVIPLLGDGLAPILNEPVTMISISGMGGFLMVDILKAHLHQLPEVHTLILQANICEYSLREYLSQEGWQIVDEDIVKDMHHLYEVIVFKRATSVLTYSSLDYQFGPILRHKKPPLFITKWEKEKAIRLKILNSIQDTQHPRYKETLKELEDIKEVLNEN